MFLGLLCNQVKLKQPLPKSPHSAFESYIQARLSRDQQRLQERYGFQPERLREFAEQVAFCIAAEDSFGLTPTRLLLKGALNKRGFTTGATFESMLDALEFLKIARSEIDPETSSSPGFTFSHRRFQEYFATCLVLKDPTRLGTRQLLTDARWREAAVVLFQSQPPCRPRIPPARSGAPS